MNLISKLKKSELIACASNFLSLSNIKVIFQEFIRDKVSSSPYSIDWNWAAVNYNRASIINLLVATNENCRYLEIGCYLNAVFDSIPVAKKVGVDPGTGGNVRKTSDDFFSDNKDQFDVIFIDGLHTYEQVKKDINNSIKALSRGGWIVLHDMLPRNWKEANAFRISRSWTGDVWKVAFELSNCEDIDFKIVKIDYGVGVLRIKKDNPIIPDLSSTLSDETFAYFYENYSKLPIIDWETFFQSIKSQS